MRHPNTFKGLALLNVYVKKEGRKEKKKTERRTRERERESERGDGWMQNVQ